MSLLFITQNYYPNKGGMAASCDRLIRNFRKNNIEVHVLHFTNRRKKFHTEAAVKGSYTALPINTSEEFTLNMASLFIEEFVLLKAIQYIVAFGGTLPINLGPIVSKWTTIPLVTFIRGNDFDEAIFSKRRKSLLYALNQSEYIFTVTQEKQDKIKKLIAHPNVYFTPNGIDSKLWQPVKSQLPVIEKLKDSSLHKKRMVIVGQLKAKKGIIAFSKTFSNFSHKEDYEVWMIGDVADTVKDYINTLDVHVRFFPFVNTNELLAFYHAADVVVIPSFYDGMPNVLLEAGASKNIVVASNVGGLKDVIEHEKDGFLFNPLQPNSLLEVLAKVHTLKEETILEISNRLFHKIDTAYTEELEIQNYLNILK